MQVKDLMTRDVRTCGPTDTTSRAAQIMWEKDCGCVPVVDEHARIVGMITDRDICMAAYTQGRPLGEISVESTASRNVVTVRENESLQRAEALMRVAQVRRVPVVDLDDRLVGLLSIGDLARQTTRDHAIEEHVVGVLVGVSLPRSEAGVPTENGDTASHGRAQDLQTELKKGLALLQTLRDEVRLRLHLGGLDLKDQWNKLEPHLGDVERKAGDLTEASRSAIVDALKKVEQFRSSLTRHH